LSETQSVSKCAEPLGIIVDNFEVRYSKENSSLYFDLSAASVVQGLNLTAQISLNAYGINALNLSVDLCSVLSGVLCPLPTYNFTGSGEYAIPPANIPSIPALAWTVPDIEAVFTVQLLDAPTRSSAACLQVTLTNTLTVRQPAVVWSTASFWILSSIIALGSPILLHSTLLSKSGSSNGGLLSSLMAFGSTWGFLLTYQLQQMALTGVLSLNYPVVLRKWTTNFAYSLGLIFTSSMSNSIDNLRANNDGDGFRTNQPSSRFISREYSPYNERLSSTLNTSTSSSTSPEGSSMLSQSTIQNLIASSINYNNASYSSGDSSRPVLASAAQSRPGQLLTSGPRDQHFLPLAFQNISSLDPGLASYTKDLGFPFENSFMISFLWFLILLAIVLSIFGLTMILLNLSVKRNNSSALGPIEELKRIGMVTLHRLNLIIYPAVTFLTFYQWSLGSSDAWSPVLLSVMVWVPLSVLMIDLSLRAHNIWSVLGFLKDNYRWLLGPFIGFEVLLLAFVGFGQGSPQAQVIPQMIIRFIETVALICFLKSTKGGPLKLKYSNGILLIVMALNLIKSGLLETFVRSNEVSPIPRAVIGFVFIAIDALGFLVVIVFGIGCMIAGLLRFTRWVQLEKKSIYL
ncbi:ML-like domain-containing protein, partial [Phakopsora pachyrhizi]